MNMALQFRALNASCLSLLKRGCHKVSPCPGSVFLVRKIHTRNFTRLYKLTSSHSQSPVTSVLFKNTLLVTSVPGSRWNSTTSKGPEYIPEPPVVPEAGTTVSTTPLPEGYIPDAPPIPLPDATETLAQSLNSLGEPAIQSLGLGSYWPSGLVQLGLEQIHCMGLPWWGAIVAGTLCLRLLVFPLVILSQKNAANMHNHMPIVQRLQERFTQARVGGNPMEAARLGNELMEYMKRNKVNPMKNMLVPFAQVPIFLSVFIGVRQMANLPVESMQTGGLLWFTDLTVADPFYALPLLTMATLYATIEFGADGVKAGSMSHNVKYVMRAMPILMCPFIINFPTAMVMYWMTSNAFSLCQVLFLKIPAVREFFKIPKMVVHDAALLPKKKGFREGFKDNWKNSKLQAQIEDRARLDAVRFKEAGMGPIQKTYTFDPTKGKPKK